MSTVKGLLLANKLYIYVMTFNETKNAPKKGGRSYTSNIGLDVHFAPMGKNYGSHHAFGQIAPALHRVGDGVCVDFSHTSDALTDIYWENRLRLRILMATFLEYFLLPR